MVSSKRHKTEGKGKGINLAFFQAIGYNLNFFFSELKEETYGYLYVLELSNLEIFVSVI